MVTVECFITVQNEVEADIVERELAQVISDGIGGTCTRLSHRDASAEEIQEAEND